jgi:hypothetical protein
MRIWYFRGTGGVEQNDSHYFFSSKAAAWKSYREKVRDNLDEDDEDASLFTEPEFFEMPSSPTRAQIVQTLNRFGGSSY